MENLLENNVCTPTKVGNNLLSKEKLDWQSDTTVEYVAYRMREDRGGSSRSGGDRDDRWRSGAVGRQYDDQGGYGRYRDDKEYDDLGEYRDDRGGGGRNEYQPRHDDYRPHSGGGGEKYCGDWQKSNDNLRYGYSDNRPHHYGNNSYCSLQDL